MIGNAGTARFSRPVPVQQAGSRAHSARRANQPIGLLNQCRQSFHQQKRQQHAEQRTEYT
jgi:hypothetical protein